MKAVVTLGAAVVFLTLGSIVPAVAQQGQAKSEQKQSQQHTQAQPQQHAQQQQAQHQNQPKQQQQHELQQAKQQNPNDQQHQQQAQHQNQPKQQQQHEQQQAKQQNHNNQQQQHHQEQAEHHGAQQAAHHSQEQQHAQQAAWQEHRSRNWNSDHRTWEQRGGYNGYRIPEERYHGHFGPNYRFVIYNQPYMVVGGFPRFQYGGYWFSVVDPWPQYWPNNWYETDNVYVVYANNGYYMHNPRYPGIGIAINVSL